MGENWHVGMRQIQSQYQFQKNCWIECEQTADCFAFSRQMQGNLHKERNKGQQSYKLPQRFNSLNPWRTTRKEWKFYLEPIPQALNFFSKLSTKAQQDRAPVTLQSCHQAAWGMCQATDRALGERFRLHGKARENCLVPKRKLFQTAVKP